jgi:hypothetical protein
MWQYKNVTGYAYIIINMNLEINIFIKINTQIVQIKKTISALS